MSTRHAPDNAPLSQEKYMSSPDYAALRGVSGNAVTAKARLMGSGRKRSLLFWLAARSLEDGGLRKVAEELSASFPERIGTETMHKLGAPKSGLYSPKDSTAIKIELGMEDGFDMSLLIHGEDRTSHTSESYSYFLSRCRNAETLATFLLDLCVNPRLLIREPKDSDTVRDAERRALMESEAVRDTEFRTAEVATFRDIVGTLFELQRRQAETAAASVARTNVARKITQTLDACLATSRMVLIEGASDAGKSTSAEAWCRAHLGEARFVRLQGVTNKTVFFRAVARALGLASSYMRTATEMQARVEDTLQRSKLMLVLDESQYAFAQGERIYSRPELVDWIYTALVNHGVPVALIASPLFSARLHQAERQTIWNSEQFKRRIYRYEVLPAKPTRNDIELVAKHHTAGVSSDVVKYVAAYAATASHPFTAITDALADARQIATAADREQLTIADVQEAVKTYRTASEFAKRTAFDEPKNGTRKGRSKALSESDKSALTTPESDTENTRTGEITNEPSTLAVIGGRRRSADTFAGSRLATSLETERSNSGQSGKLQEA